MSIKLSNYLIQDSENRLICKEDCNLTINLFEYTMNDNIIINEIEKIIWVKNLISEIDFGNDIKFNLVLDYPVNVNIIDMEYVKNKYIKLFYKMNTVIFSLTTEIESIKQQIPYIERLLGGKEPYKDPSRILKKLISFGSLSGLDTIHLEVLISNCLRDKNNNNIPARLGKTWDPVLINIKDIVFNTSFIQGLEFENVGKAISTGLIQKESSPSVLEKILTGELVNN